MITVIGGGRLWFAGLSISHAASLPTAPEGLWYAGLSSPFKALLEAANYGVIIEGGGGKGREGLWGDCISLKVIIH